MALELSVTGKGLQDLKRKVKALDDKKLMRQINKALREEAKPLIPIALQAAGDSLPKRGGLADIVAGGTGKIAVTQKGVRVVIKSWYVSTGYSSRHRLRHPVFGNREVWVNQPLQGGWFDMAMKAHAGDVRPGIVAAIEKFSKEVADA